MKIVRKYIDLLKRKYLQWRYWNCIYRNMNKQINSHNDKSTEKLTPYINKPGIAFSFDDSYRINDWYKYGKNMFGYYDVKVTFNINGVHPLEGHRVHTQQEVDKLLELQANGHEIAHHSFKHKNATEYSKKYGLEQWLEDEINTLFQWMEKQSHSKTKEYFKKPVTFAFPHFKYNETILSKLIPKYFKTARVHLFKDNLASFNHIGLVPSICLDSYYSCNSFYIKKIIRLAKKSGKNLILTCHSILPEEVYGNHNNEGEKSKKWGKWRISPKLIQTIIDEARKNDMDFYTTSEISGIATFIDRNFERAVREKISKPDGWIEIVELNEVKELDLSNRGISNLDGLEYFLNLEKLDLRNNLISDFRLLGKLPKLNQVNTEFNHVNIRHKGKVLSSMVKSSFILYSYIISQLLEYLNLTELC